jgi:hypothetical protein
MWVLSAQWKVDERLAGHNASLAILDFIFFYDSRMQRIWLRTPRDPQQSFIGGACEPIKPPQNYLCDYFLSPSEDGTSLLHPF